MLHRRKKTSARGIAEREDPFGVLGEADTADFAKALSELTAHRSRADDPAAAAAATESPTCAHCGGAMLRATSNIESTCAGCGLVREGDSTEPDDSGAPRSDPTQLRIVGPNSSRLQPDLYRSGNGNSSATQQKQMANEYLVYRSYYIEAGGRAFPINACELAAEYYNRVQQTCVKRNDKKRVIMAALLKQACAKVGFSPTVQEVAAFMQLQSKGIARGENFVRSLVADGAIEDPGVDADSSRPEIATLFARFGFEGEQYDDLRRAVSDLVQLAIAHNIGTNSTLRSKIAGATFVVLRRCTDAALVPEPITLPRFCDVQHIRKNTIERFLQKVEDHHSFFVELYRREKLDDGPAPKR